VPDSTPPNNRLYAHRCQASTARPDAEDARRALEDCLRDEPQWHGRLEVKEVEFDHEHTSLN
jgi:hypothetical protein